VYQAPSRFVMSWLAGLWSGLLSAWSLTGLRIDVVWGARRDSGAGRGVISL
jgi:hypothetical protein